MTHNIFHQWGIVLNSTKPYFTWDGLPHISVVSVLVYTMITIFNSGFEAQSSQKDKNKISYML